MGFTSRIYSWASSRMSERELKEAAYNAGYKIKRISEEKRSRKEQRRAKRLVKKLDVTKDPASEEAEAKKAEKKQRKKQNRVRQAYMILIVELRVKYQNNPDCLDFPKLYAERYVPFALERGVTMKSFNEFVKDVKSLKPPEKISI